MRSLLSFCFAAWFVTAIVSWGATAKRDVSVAALPGMPPILDTSDIYAANRPNNLSSVVKGFRSLVYVPNSDSHTVDVIDPKTYKIIDHFAVGRQPQHVTPSYDLKTLWVLNDQGNTLTRINPATGKVGESIPV